MDRSWAWVTAAWPYVIVLLVPIGAWSEHSPFVAWAALANALLVVVAFFVATAVHELGHATVARLVGARVLRVQIGRGPRIASFDVGTTQVRIGVSPIGGLTWVDTAPTPLPRLREWLWTLGGPAATVALLLALLRIADPDRSTGWVLGDGLLARVAPLQVLALVSAVQLVWLAVSSSEGDDLARLLRIPFRRASAAAEGEALRVETANADAWALAVSGETGKAREAVPIARALYQDYPSYPWIAGTYGTALVAAGQVELGMRMLRDAYDDNLDDGLRAHNAAWLAIAEARRGRADRAARWRAEAERLDPSCESLGLFDAEPPPAA